MILKIALTLLVVVSLIGLGYLFFISHKMLRRVQKQEALEKSQVKALQHDNLDSSLNKKK